jgi:hypothetical protein
MPPCPPGWTQSGPSSCVEPFKCPEGWVLAAGPVCVPHVCKEDKDCSWKNNRPCAAAEVCVDGTGTAKRVCEDGKCPAGLTCKPSKLCTDGRSLEKVKFTNWNGSTSAPTSAPAASSARPSSSDAPASSGAATTASSSSTSPTTTAAPKKGGCSSCDAPGSLGSSAGGALVAIAIAAGLVVRRKRR